MALALRRTGSGNYPDWDVIEDGTVVGRIQEILSPPTQGVRWLWAHNLVGAAQGEVTTGGRAATFEDAKAQFAEALAAFREWPGKSEESDPRPADGSSRGPEELRDIRSDFLNRRADPT
jgi:hypothetical protein